MACQIGTRGIKPSALAKYAKFHYRFSCLTTRRNGIWGRLNIPLPLSILKGK